MYTVRNFQTKKELVAAFRAGDLLRVYQPSGVCPALTGRHVIEGPHYPEDHRWHGR